MSSNRTPFFNVRIKIAENVYFMAYNFKLKVTFQTYD